MPYPPSKIGVLNGFYRATSSYRASYMLSHEVGDDASTKMFKKADLEDPKLLQLFQKLFDDTKASIVTRDRAARGAGDMPRGYRVQKVVSEGGLKVDLKGRAEPETDRTSSIFIYFHRK